MSVAVGKRRISRFGSRHRKLILASGTVAGMIVAGVAVAFFTGGAGTGTGNATVGSESALSVSVNSSGATGGPLYPGSGTAEKIPFTATNNSSGHQGVTSLTYTIANDGSGNVVTGVSNTPVTGCLSSWFSASGDSSNPSLPDDLAGGGAYSGEVDVTMSDVGSSQDACQGVTPNVTVTAN